MKKNISRVALALLVLFMLASVWRGPTTSVQANPFTGPDIEVRWLLEPQFDFDLVVNFHGGIAGVEVLEDYGWIHVLGYLNTRGEIVIPIDYRHPEPHYFYRGAPRFTYGAGGIHCMDRGGVAFFDSSGRQLTEFIFTEGYDFSQGLAAARLGGWEETPGGDWVDNSRWGFLDTRGNTAIPFDFEYAGRFTEGLAGVVSGGRWGFIDADGNVEISFIFDRHQGWNWWHTPVFNEGRAVVWQEDQDHPDWHNYQDEAPGHWGYIDRQGNMITGFEFSNARPFSEGLAAVSTGGGGTDAHGNWVDNTRWGFIDLYGNVAIPIIYSSVGTFSEGLAPARIDDHYGFIDQTGREIVSPRYSSARSFSEGRAAVLGEWGVGPDWGFIDQSGNEVIPRIYDWVNDFSYGLAAVRIGGWETDQWGNWVDNSGWGFIDRMGNEVVPLIFEDARSFQEGLAWVRQNGLWGVLQIVETDPPTGTTEADFYQARYDHQPERHTFTPSPETLAQVYDPGTAHTQISSLVSSLTPQERASADALNLATLQIENIARRGTTQSAPAGDRFTGDVINNSTVLAWQIHHGTEHILTGDNVSLMRDIRNNINFESDNNDEISAAFPDDVSGIPFDNLTIESEFAAITLNREYIPVGGEINVRRLESDDAEDGDDGVLNRLVRLPQAVSDFSSPMTILANLWSLLAVFLLLIIWLIVAAFKERLRRWVVPTFAILAIIANAALVMWRMEPPPGIAATVEVTMTPGMKATVSLPTNGANPDFLVLINEDGDIMHSRYNPVTGNIDARVREGGTYILRENQVSFADIGDTSQHMQDAILQLASRGIMQGATEGHFRPEDPISRTDLIATIVTAFDMVDINAQTTFTDIAPEAWYYLAVATAQQEGLISGFADGTFRGDINIPKDQLVALSANMLIERMGYNVPLNVEFYLARFHDRAQLAPWSEDGIALATASNVLVHRADNMFAPRSAMTRGDAAVILYRVFSRVW